MSFLLSEQFRLEIHWDMAIYNQEGICELKGARFTGPALQIAQKVNEEDHLMLDLYSQYLSLVKGVYVVKFSWSGTRYSADGNIIYLDKCFITHNSELNKVPNLKASDYFVIDTRDHESSVHQYALVYKTLLIKEDSTRYRFNK